METEEKRTLRLHVKRLTALFAVTIMTLLCLLTESAFAESGKIEVAGKIYEFDKDSNYEFRESSAYAYEETDGSNTYGTFFINGSVSNINKKSGVPAYEVSDGNLTFYYNYGDAVLNAGEDEWHLVDDKSKKADDINLPSDIMKGAIIIQTSRDGKNWVNVDTICNAFADMPIRTSPIYTTTDVQLINGCYYRVMVVYELAVRTEEGKILFVKTDKYDYKKYAETYEFYAYTDSGDTNVTDPNQTYSLGSKVRAKNFDGYFARN